MRRGRRSGGWARERPVTARRAPARAFCSTCAATQSAVGPPSTLSFRYARAALRLTAFRALQASSVPISIPSQFKRRAGEHAAEPAEPLTFVPPHQLSHRDPHAILADGSIPLSSSSKLRNRNIVLRSTGFLPAHCTEGFLIPRAHAGGSTAGASGHIGAAPSLSERRSDRRKSQQLTAAVLEPLQRLLSEQSASGALSVQASLPERGAGGSPAPQPVPSAQ